MPSTTTVQTPQVARLQLRTVPVSPIFSEITSHSVVRTSCSTVWAVPLRLKVDDIEVMACGSGAADAAPVASTLRRNGDTTAGAATAPATMPVATLALMKFLRVNFAMRFPSRASGYGGAAPGARAGPCGILALWSCTLVEHDNVKRSAVPPQIRTAHRARPKVSSVSRVFFDPPLPAAR